MILEGGFCVVEENHPTQMALVGGKPVSSASSLFLAHPHRAMGPRGTQTATHLRFALCDPLPLPPVVIASSSNRELPFHPLYSLLRTELCTGLDWPGS